MNNMAVVRNLESSFTADQLSKISAIIERGYNRTAIARSIVTRNKISYYALRPIANSNCSLMARSANREDASDIAME